MVQSKRLLTCQQVVTTDTTLRPMALMFFVDTVITPRSAGLVFITPAIEREKAPEDSSPIWEAKV